MLPSKRQEEERRANEKDASETSEEVCHPEVLSLPTSTLTSLQNVTEPINYQCRSQGQQDLLGAHDNAAFDDGHRIALSSAESTGRAHAQVPSLPTGQLGEFSNRGFNKACPRAMTTQGNVANPPGSTIPFDREIVDLEYMEEEFGLLPEETNLERLSRWIKSSCKCTFPWFLSLLMSLCPVVIWLPKYRLKFLLLDMISGFTIAILHIPQGMAYGILACVRAENGLYVSFFPVLVYFVLGTSKHGSIGTFAVISLMLNSAVTNIGAVETRNLNITQLNITVYSSAEPPTSLEVVTSLAMGVGLWQIFMGVFQLGALTVLLSDNLISGFTTGAAIHVATAQMKYLFGIHVGNYRGVLKIVYMYRDIFCHITESNVATVIVSAVSIFVLAVFKEHFDEFFRKRFKMPFPIDLVVVIAATAVSYFGNFNERYHMNIAGEIPTGLPSPTAPRMDLLPRLLLDSLSIAVVIFAVSLAMAKLFAKKHNYTVSATQELIALGSANIISSFFACFPSSISLARSTVQERAGGQTQVAGLISCGFLLLVLLFLAPVFYHLPKCILSAIIIVALKRIFMQVNDFTKAWKISKPDAMVWLVTFLASVLIDVSYGLLIGVIFSISTVVLRTALPSRTLLGNIPGTDLYFDAKRYTKVREIPGVKIFRFESALYFLNRQLFRTSLFKNVPVPRRNISSSDTDEKVSSDHIHHVIIDCSSFAYVDWSGLQTLIEVSKEYKESGITLLLSGCSVSMFDLMIKGNFFKDDSYQPRVFPTIHDAIRFCCLPTAS